MLAFTTACRGGQTKSSGRHPMKRPQATPRPHQQTQRPPPPPPFLKASRCVHLLHLAHTMHLTYGCAIWKQPKCPRMGAALAVDVHPSQLTTRINPLFLFVLAADYLGVRQDEGPRVRPMVRGDVLPAVPAAAGAAAPIAATAARRSWAVTCEARGGCPLAVPMGRRGQLAYDHRLLHALWLGCEDTDQWTLDMDYCKLLWRFLSSGCGAVEWVLGLPGTRMLARMQMLVCRDRTGFNEP